MQISLEKRQTSIAWLMSAPCIPGFKDANQCIHKLSKHSDRTKDQKHSDHTKKSVIVIPCQNSSDHKWSFFTILTNKQGILHRNHKQTTLGKKGIYLQHNKKLLSCNLLLYPFLFCFLLLPLCKVLQDEFNLRTMLEERPFCRYASPLSAIPRLTSSIMDISI